MKPTSMAQRGDDVSGPGGDRRDAAVTRLRAITPVGVGAAAGADRGGQAAADHPVGGGPAAVLGQDRHRVGGGLELPADRADRRAYRGDGVVQPLGRTVAAHGGHRHADEEGSEQHRTEHHCQEGSSQSAT